MGDSWGVGFRPKADIVDITVLINGEENETH